jgi:elongation factor G
MILLWLGIKPRTPENADRLGRALQTLLAADPTLALQTPADDVTMLGAGSDEQLDAAIHRLVHEFHIEAEVTGIEIAYKEALTRGAAGEAKYATQSGARGQYGHVRIVLQPGQPASGFVFDNAIVGGAIPEAFVAPIAEGLREAARRGVLAGYPIEDVRATLEDGSYHDRDSSAEAFRIAAGMAFRAAAKNALPMLLEPIMHVFLQTPEEYAARAIALLTARRGALLLGTRQSDDWQTISARLPISETFGLDGELRKKTGGRGVCFIRFSHFAPAALADDGGDRDTPVREPTSPRTPPRVLRASVPEPEPEAFD